MWSTTRDYLDPVQVFSPFYFGGFGGFGVVGVSVWGKWLEWAKHWPDTLCSFLVQK